MKSWWQRRGLRARLTLIASAALAVGIAAGSVLLLHGFASSRLSAIDTTSRTVSTNLAGLVEAGALPQLLPVGAGQTAQVVTADDAILAASPGTLRTLPLLPAARLRRLAQSGPANQPVDTINGQSADRVRVREVASGGATEYVVIAVSLADERDTLNGLTRLVFIGAPILLIAVAGTLWLLLGQALRTVNDLRIGAESITDPTTDNRLPVPTSNDEIHYLATTLNAMIGRMATATQRERAFIADAAHELRSPIAGLRTQLEMAVSTADPSTSREFAEGALNDAERLSDLVQDLLALARLDSGTPLPHQPVDLAELAGVACDEPCIVTGDAATLRRAIDNLRSNAERHAAARIDIAVSRTEDDTINLHVDDDGPGVAPEQRERIFERFVRVDPARTRDEGGTGLGLAIVHATALAHHGTVSVTDSPLGGARFTLSLPGAATAVVPTRGRRQPIESSRSSCA